MMVVASQGDVLVIVDEVRTEIVFRYPRKCSRSSNVLKAAT